jgi:hypothetical protein
LHASAPPPRPATMLNKPVIRTIDPFWVGTNLFFRTSVSHAPQTGDWGQGQKRSVPSAVRSLRIWDWRQGGYIHLHNLYFCRQFLAKATFRDNFFFRHSGEIPCTCRHSGKNGTIDNIAGSLCICAYAETCRKGSGGNPENVGKI